MTIMPGRSVTATLHDARAPIGPGGTIPLPALEQLARLMDSQFVVPGLGVRFGLDALLGLIPGLGDVASSLISLYIVAAAAQQGVSRVTIARMALNLGLDALLGSVPVVGDIIDVGYKANNRNVALLQRSLAATPGERRSGKRADGLFVVGMLALLVLVLAGAIALTAFWVWLLLRMFNLA